MDFLLILAIIVFVVALLFFCTSFFGTRGKKRGAKCTQKGIAVIEKVINESRSDSGVYFNIRYQVGEKEYTESVPLEYTDDIKLTISSGEEVPIWYCPENPKTVIIGNDRFMTQTVKSWQGTRKRALIAMIIALLAFIILWGLK